MELIDIMNHILCKLLCARVLGGDCGSESLLGSLTSSESDLLAENQTWDDANSGSVTGPSTV